MTSEQPLMHPLTSAVLELEAHVNEDGWDQPTRLFAMARLGDLLRREPALAEAMGLVDAGDNADELIPVEQEWSPGDAKLDDALGLISWPEQVLGVAIAMERILLPPSAEADLSEDAEMSELIEQAMGHPARREVRLAVAVMRDGRNMCAIRLRDNDADDDVLTGQDLVPGLTEALATTLR